ncbi:MAG TPA: AraC family transcriptional regulator [Pseudomonadales bacterium]|jgi:AraC-like DNA-binding protein
MSTETVPTKFARSLIELAVQRGYSVADVLRTAGLPFNPLKPDHVDYQSELSALQYSAIYQQVLSLLQDETFGLHATGERVSPGAFRMMCYCIIHCDNLGHAIRRASEFYRIFFERTARLSLVQDDISAALGFSAVSPRPLHLPVQTEEVYGLSTWHRFCGWLIGEPLPLREVHFQGTKPDVIRKYEQIFACPLLFDQPANALVLDLHYLQLPLVHTEKTVKEFLRTAPYQLLVMPAEKPGTGLVAQVRALIGQDFSQGFPSFAKISRALNMSEPTLRRRLKREGTSFQQLKDDCRRDAAIAYLSRPDLSINAVAALMGFTDPSAFHRSFKKWTGMPPGQYRQLELGAAHKPE